MTTHTLVHVQRYKETNRHIVNSTSIAKEERVGLKFNNMDDDMAANNSRLRFNQEQAEPNSASQGCETPHREQ